VEDKGGYTQRTEKNMITFRPFLVQIAYSDIPCITLWLKV